jgi:hypothetical protein
MLQGTKGRLVYRLGALLGLFGCIVILGCQQPITPKKKADTGNTGDTGSGGYAEGVLEAGETPDKVMLTIPLVKSSGNARTLAGLGSDEIRDKDEYGNPIDSPINYYMLIAVDDADKTTVFDYATGRKFNNDAYDPALTMGLLRGMVVAPETGSKRDYADGESVPWVVKWSILEIRYL